METGNGNLNSTKARKPVAMAGAGNLASSLWKVRSEHSGFCYRFNIFRLSKSGRTGQTFRPSDLKDFTKLVQVLASAIADDGWISASERQELTTLAITLDEVLRRIRSSDNRSA